MFFLYEHLCLYGVKECLVTNLCFNHSGDD